MAWRILQKAYGIDLALSIHGMRLKHGRHGPGPRHQTSDTTGHVVRPPRIRILPAHRRSDWDLGNLETLCFLLRSSGHSRVHCPVGGPLPTVIAVAVRRYATMPGWVIQFKKPSHEHQDPGVAQLHIAFYWNDQWCSLHLLVVLMLWLISVHFWFSNCS